MFKIDKISNRIIPLQVKGFAEVESNFGQELEWLLLEDKKSSRIQFRKPFDSDNRDNWPEIIEWLVSNMTLLEKALRQPLAEAGSKLKVLGIAESDD